jgi:hypothetical protein
MRDEQKASDNYLAHRDIHPSIAMPYDGMSLFDRTRTLSASRDVETNLNLSIGHGADTLCLSPIPYIGG